MNAKKSVLIVALSVLTITLMAGEKKSSYFESKVVSGSMDEVQQKTAAALKTVGFGILSTSNMHEKLNKQPGVNLKPYRILGVCNPKYAVQAIAAEENIGLFLPCKVILKDKGNGTIEVVFGRPDFIMGSMGNEKLKEIGKLVTADLKSALNKIE